MSHPSAPFCYYFAVAELVGPEDFFTYFSYQAVALHSITLIAGSLDAVKLIRVNISTYRPETLECLIHLLATLQHVEVSFTTEQCRRLDSIGM